MNARSEHRVADLLALGDVALALRGLDQVVDERVDALRAGGAEHVELVVRQIALREDAVADRVVDVVVDVGDAVDDAHDLPLESRGSRSPVCVRIPSSIRGWVEPLGDAKRLLVVAEAATETFRERGVERLLAGVAERCVAHVVTEADRLDEVFVQAQRGRRRGRCRSSRACGSCACGSGRRPGR